MVKPFDWQIRKLFHDTPTLTVSLTFCLPPAVCTSLCVLYCIPMTFKFYVILGYIKVALFNGKRADIKLNVTSFALDLVKRRSLVLKQQCVVGWTNWVQWVNRMWPWKENQTVTGWTSGLAVPVAGSAHSPWHAVSLPLPCEWPTLVFDSFRAQFFIVGMTVLTTQR